MVVLDICYVVVDIQCADHGHFPLCFRLHALANMSALVGGTRLDHGTATVAVDLECVVEDLVCIAAVAVEVKEDLARIADSFLDLRLAFGHHSQHCVVDVQADLLVPHSRIAGSIPIFRVKFQEVVVLAQRGSSFCTDFLRHRNSFLELTTTQFPFCDWFAWPSHDCQLVFGFLAHTFLGD